MAGPTPGQTPPTSSTPAQSKPVLLEYPSTIGKGSSDIDNYMMFEAFDFKKPTKQTLNIALYIPGGALNTSYKSEYESVALGGAGAAAGDVAKVVEKGINSDAGFSLTDFASVVAAQATAVQSEGMKVGILKAGERANVVQEGAKTIMERTTGAVLNPFLTAAYKGPSDMRTHDFDFKMLPQDVNESKTCLKIVNAFKRAMLPSHAGGDSKTAPSMLFGYPDTFTITFYIGGEKLPDGPENPMFNIGRSVLTGCDLNYDTENVPLFFDGTQYPVTIEMKLSFMEIDVMYREKVAKGF